MCGVGYCVYNISYTIIYCFYNSFLNNKIISIVIQVQTSELSNCVVAAGCISVFVFPTFPVLPNAP